MSTTVYAVALEQPLDVVVTTMAEHKYGSAVVMHNSTVVGIFTTVDACRMLASCSTRASPRRECPAADLSPGSGVAESRGSDPSPVETLP